MTMMKKSFLIAIISILAIYTATRWQPVNIINGNAILLLATNGSNFFAEVSGKTFLSFNNKVYRVKANKKLTGNALIVHPLISF